MLRSWLGAHRLSAGAMLGIASAGAVAAVLGICVVAFGLYDVSATSLHSAPASWLIHTTMIRSVRVRAPEVGPTPHVFASDIALGAREYAAHCEMCHGGPGVSRAQWANGLTPTPPYIIDAARQWSPQELRFIVGNGVKMTAMPAWGMTLNDRQLWAVVAFVEELPKLTRTEYLRATRREQIEQRTASAARP